MSQIELALKINYSPEHLNSVLSGYRTITPEAAEKISNAFPGEVSAAWLLGYSEYKTVAHHFDAVIAQADKEAALLFNGLSSFALLSGYEIIPPKIGGNSSLNELFKEMRSGYIIKKEEKTVSLSLEEMNLFENEVNDFVELMLKHLFKREDYTHG